MKILSGIGVGELKHGMYEKDIVGILGKPDRIDEGEYVEGTGDWNKELWYSPRNLTFTFYQDDDYRLSTITVMGGGYTLFNKNLFGQKLDSLSKLVSIDTGEIAKYEDWSSEELPEHECLIHDGLGILF